MFAWRDSFVVIGSYYQSYTFNITTQLWSLLNTFPPVQLFRPGCVVLPNEEILVTAGVNYLRKSFIFNRVANTWRAVSDTNNDQGFIHNMRIQISHYFREIIC